MCFWSSSFSLPLWVFPKQLQFVTLILQLFIFSVKLLLLSQSRTCNKVHVIPSVIYFYGFCCFVYMFNNHCFSQIYFLFGVLAREMSIIFLQSAGAAFASCLSMHTLRSFSLIPSSWIFTCISSVIFILLCACRLSQHSPCTLYSFSLLARFSSEDIYFLSIKSIYPKAISNSLTKVKSIPSLPQAKFLVLCSSPPRPK